MAGKLDAPNNAFASAPVQNAQVQAAARKRFPGIGAKVQGRPGTSLQQMADRMHPVSRKGS